jgi:large subunit ribosomal protein L15
MKLNDLIPNHGSKKEPKRKGHGISAGQGKTAGRGTKGQGSRSGEGGHLYRQGGNLPFFRRLPFIRGEGFTPPNRVEYSVVNLYQLAQFASDSVVSPVELAEAICFRSLNSRWSSWGRVRFPSH